MNKTRDIVNLWADFEAKHPNSNIDDFCRYQLIRKREKSNKQPFVGGAVPTHPAGILLKIMGRIHKINMVYAYAALAGTGVNQLEEFGMMLIIQQEKNPRKTEVIFSMLMELSSGTDMLKRLINKKFVTESDDKDDKRSKRLTLTTKGAKTIEDCKVRVGKLAKMVLSNMEEDDIQLCIKLLKATEQKLSSGFQETKGQSFEEIHKQVNELL
jgi:DNA-binding MarR family transcriptional regulator